MSTHSIPQPTFEQNNKITKDGVFLPFTFFDVPLLISPVHRMHKTNSTTGILRNNNLNFFQFRCLLFRPQLRHSSCKTLLHTIRINSMFLPVQSSISTISTSALISAIWSIRYTVSIKRTWRPLLYKITVKRVLLSIPIIAGTKSTLWHNK